MSGKATKFTGKSGKAFKTKVDSNIGGLVSRRFFHNNWSCRCCQLTSYHTAQLSKISLSDLNAGGSKIDPIHSDIQTHTYHQFQGEEHPSLIVTVPESSKHIPALIDGAKVSIMTGHTDPQIFSFFKEINAVPPRSITTGTVELLDAHRHAEVWEDCLVRHPRVQELAEALWHGDMTKSDEEKEEMSKRVDERDKKIIEQMSSSDWRKKFQERERAPTPQEQVEEPLFVVKPSTWLTFRLRPRVQAWVDCGGEMVRVFDDHPLPPDPLGKHVQKTVHMLNVSRMKTVSAFNTVYNMPIVNQFVYSLDENGIYAMATKDRIDEWKNDLNAEHWSEYFFEYGKDQKITSNDELDAWIRGLMKFGTPDAPAQESGGATQARAEDSLHEML